MVKQVLVVVVLQKDQVEVKIQKDLAGSHYHWKSEKEDYEAIVFLKTLRLLEQTASFQVVHVWPPALLKPAL